MQEEDFLNEAYQRLARSECSASQLKTHLSRKGADNTTAEAVAEVLTRQGYLDDSRTAENLITDLRKVKLWGIERVRLKLEETGIDTVVAEERIERSLAELSEEENLTKVVRKLSLESLIESKEPSEQSKAYRKLSSLGYEEDLVAKLFI